MLTTTEDLPRGVAELLDAPAIKAELEKLAQLKAQGIVSEEEFAAKKAQLLGI